MIQTAPPPTETPPPRRTRRVWPPLPLPVLAPLAVLLVLGILMAISPVARDRGDDFLSAFRTERRGNLTIIDIPLPSVPGVDAAAITDAISLELPAGREVQYKYEADQAVDFNLRSLRRPQALPKITVFIDETATLRFDRAAMEKALAGALGPSVRLPAELDAPVLAQIAAGVRFQWTEPGGMLSLYVTRNPRFYTTQGPTWEELRTRLVQFSSIIAPARAQALQSVEDWANTVLVPVPPGAATRRVRADNTDDALLIERPGRSTLIWQRYGIVHVLDGYPSGNELVRLADTLR